ncbi:MAG: aldehyde dehydrogenase family protein [Pigmentiphaga sp.]
MFDTHRIGYICMNYSNTIAGSAAVGEAFFDVINPATGEAFTQAPSANEAQVDQAVRAAGEAFLQWGRSPHADRVRRLLDFADAIDQEHEDLSRLLTIEQGKPLARARDEVRHATHYLRKLVELPLGPERLLASDGRSVELHHRPLGVVAAITPWNVPVLLAIWKIGHALVTGNTLLLKPAPTTPLTTLRLGEIGREIFPVGVFNVLAGGDVVGQAMIAHDAVAKVSFTGSVAVGRKVAASAGAALKRTTLELGGNDAAIVLKDVDIEKMAPAVFAAAFTNAGQACMAVKRVYVDESIFDSFVARLKICCDKIVVGNGLDDGVHMGPVHNRRQFDSVRSVIAEARQAGADLHVGTGALPERGFFLAPHLAIAPSIELRVVHDETFGPILPVLPFRSEDDAIAAANASPFGLSGSVWTSDQERGRRLVERLEVGSAWVNRHVDYDAHIPFGGVKCSGIGRENSVYGLRHYTELQAVYY